MKSFFGGFFINEERLKKEGIYHPIKLEYYKKIEQIGKQNTEDNFNNGNEFSFYNNVKYGVEIIKTQYIQDKVLVEKEEIGEITTDEAVIEKILSILKTNEVTPISVRDVMIEIFTKNLQNVEN